jgi:dimeric dUTPase (all-alpha-NTP-PPase superfamily)
LGHNSVDVKRAYAKKTKLKFPRLEDFESKIINCHTNEQLTVEKANKGSPILPSKFWLLIFNFVKLGMEKPDQFNELFRMQKALNERIGVNTDGMSEQEKTKWILNYCRAMSQEMAELTDSVPWKWWAKYQKFDEQNARVEVVDLFHFLISMAQVLGMSANDVYDAYVKKNEVNFKRQKDGYTTKDQDDSKHI